MKPHPPTTRIYSLVLEPLTLWSSKIREFSVNGAIASTEVVPDQKDAGLEALESILHEILEWLQGKRQRMPGNVSDFKYFEGLLKNESNSDP